MREQQTHAWWLLVGVFVAGVWTVAACGEETSADPGASTSSGGASSGDNGSSGESSSSGETSSSGGSSGETSSGQPPGTATGATPANFKVAFIGDTDTGNDFKDVLDLIVREGAQAVMIQGDLMYGGHDWADWQPVADAALQAGATKIPYFISKGNHDFDWNNVSAGLDTKYAAWNVKLDSDKPSNVNYSLTYNGLKMVFVGDSTTNGGSLTARADYVKTQLANDKQIWKICSWHKNMRDTNVGPKSDEMSWQIYENCRAAGAIVAQGHSHTYGRSKTLTADQALTVDATCSDPFALCVGPNKHFLFDSSVGGTDLRTLEEANKPHWASSYSSDFGALFIEFNVDGDPHKAKGYFKTVGNMVIDPPANSGKTFFTITSTN